MYVTIDKRDKGSSYIAYICSLLAKRFSPNYKHRNTMPFFGTFNISVFAAFKELWLCALYSNSNIE